MAMRGLAAAALSLVLVGPAGAIPVALPITMASADPFSALVGKRRVNEEARSGDQADVQRYIVSADGRAFLFARNGRKARVKFLCSEEDPRLDCRIDPNGSAEEIFLLYGAQGPRGDTIYKDAEGDTMLRIGAYGGATVFWPGETYGQPAAKSYSDKESVSLPRTGRRDAYRRARFATAHLSALTGEPIVFDIAPRRAPRTLARLESPSAAAVAFSAPEENQSTEEAPEKSSVGAAPLVRDASVLADAVARVASGMQRVADDPTGARILGARIKSVRFIEGDGPELSLERGELLIVYDPSGGVAGRPTSDAVFRFLEETL